MIKYFKSKKFLLTASVFCIILAVSILAVSMCKDVFTSRFTKSEMLDDYEYFWSSLEENWPYFDVAKENDLDLNKIKKKYKWLISIKPSDKNFYKCMSDMTAEISSNEALGEVYAVDKLRLSLLKANNYNSNKAIETLFNDKDTIESYSYINEQLVSRPIYNYDLSINNSSNNKELSQEAFDKNIQLAIIEQDKIAKITINSMFISDYDKELEAVYKENFESIYTKIKDYDHVIFDLSECVGANPCLWKSYIVTPNIKVDKNYTLTCLYNETENNKSFYEVATKPVAELSTLSDNEHFDNLSSYFDYNINVRHNLYKNNIAKAKKWIIIGEDTKLEANNFAYFAEQTDFATVVGKSAGRLNVPAGVGMIRLPNLGLFIAYDGLQYLDSDGVNKLESIEPHIQVPDSEYALDICLNKIEEYETKVAEFNGFLKSVNGERKELVESESSILDAAQYTPNYKEEIDAFTKGEIEELMKKEDSRAVTKQEALEDVETLFKLFKYTYAGYHYFGGDTTYDNAKLSIINTIKDFEQEEIPYLEFREILVGNFDFMQDTHTNIAYVKNNEVSPDDKIRLCKEYDMYINNAYDISCDDGKYYISIDNKKMEIESFADDKNLEKYIKPTINDEGQIYYNLFSIFLDENEASKYSNITLNDGKDKRILKIKWVLSENASRDYEEIYEEMIIDGVKVFKVNRFMPSDDKEETMLQRFKRNGHDAKNENIFIIDLRGNNGGHSNYGMEWLYNYLGKYPKYLSVWSEKLTWLSFYLTGRYNEYQMTKEEKDSLSTGNWSIYECKLKEWYENDNIIIVLIDNNTASASELMMGELSIVDNVIFIGSNTSGAGLTFNPSYTYLPNSKLAIYCGSGLFFTKNMDNNDGIGYFPDIWVNPVDALDKAIEMCNYYNLSGVIK